MTTTASDFDRILNCGPLLSFDTANNVFTCRDDKIELPEGMRSDFLRLLFQYENQVVTRSMLLSASSLRRQHPGVVEPHIDSVDVVMSNLRKTLGVYRDIIHTVWGRGYILTCDPEVFPDIPTWKNNKDSRVLSSITQKNGTVIHLHDLPAPRKRRLNDNDKFTILKARTSKLISVEDVQETYKASDAELQEWCKRFSSHPDMHT